jgi:hypothetical protein
MSPQERTPEKVAGGVPKVPDSWNKEDGFKDTLRLESGEAYSMAEVLEGVAGLCKSRFSADEDAQDRDTLAAEAEDVLQQMRDQLGIMVNSSAPEPEEKRSGESGSKSEEVLKSLKAGADGGFPRKSALGKNHTCLHRVWV